MTREILGVPDSYIPLDSFSGGWGYFYNKETGEVLGLGLGGDLKKFKDGGLRSQWGDFNKFIEWFFGI